MIFSPYIDTAISILFILVLMSLTASFLNEAIINLINFRGKFLRWRLEKALTKELTKTLYDHSLIDSLQGRLWVLSSKNFRRWPSYIPTRFFSKALADVVADRDSKEIFEESTPLENNEQEKIEEKDKILKEFKAAIPAIKDKSLKRLFQSLLQGTNSNGSSSLFSEIDKWFEAYMAQGTRQYRGNMQITLLIISLFLAVFTHFDVITTTKAIFENDILRERMTAMAMVYAEQAKDAEGVKSFQDVSEQVKNIQLPIGWDTQQFELRNLYGWLASAVLISFGAPFWFDLLSGIVSVRKLSRESSEEE